MYIIHVYTPISKNFVAALASSSDQKKGWFSTGNALKPDLLSAELILLHAHENSHNISTLGNKSDSIYYPHKTRAHFGLCLNLLKLGQHFLI